MAGFFFILDEVQSINERRPKKFLPVLDKAVFYTDGSPKNKGNVSI